MRRSRPLTRTENWELAILLIIIVSVLLTSTLIWRLSRVPHLWAVMPPRAAMAVENTASTMDTAPNTDMQNKLTLPIKIVAPTSTIVAGDRLVPIRQRVFPRPIIQRRIIRHTDSYWFHGHRYVYWKTLDLRVTSYAPDRQCCWPYPGTTTASGASVWTNHGHLVAADTSLIPFHCMVRVPGYDYDHPVPVLDRGGAIHGYRLDVLAPTFWSAQHWGVKVLRVRIYRPVAR